MTWLRVIDLLKLPTVNSIHDLSMLTGLSSGLLFKLSNVSEYYYKTVIIPKKNGGTRSLACPSKAMKAVQAWILRNILDEVPIHPAATAFVKGANLVNNVEPHLNHKFFLCCDMENFFGSIREDAIYRIFHSLGYIPEIARLFTNICCYNGRLPQGGVTSPALSNLVCIRLDERLAKYSGARHVNYTRYADDLTFSSNKPETLVPIKSTVKWVLSEYNLRLNDSKTRFLGPRQCCRVTGLVISGSTYSIGRKQKRILRSKIYNLQTGKLDETEYQAHRNHINGWMSFLKDVDVTGYKQLSAYWTKLRQLSESKEAAPTGSL